MLTHDASALMEYRGYSVEKAIRTVLDDKIAPAGATGGIIAVDKEGTWATHHTSPGMLRGVVTHETGPSVSIFDDAR
ncbi:MAG TPA: isoaspartyl peptidase/L-asparaginase [Myxococcales bacterium LLY-WYZ-16_1]|nr:isoaspartyl peptidase/L-asparaginase [Myxococcales bacterium LLY-WYZ-16_1]